ncbi:MAG: adenosylmethionine--8-amino-7-oxononanoate transaminase [Verrucomicrobiia bacterium]
MNRLAELDKKYVWHPFTQMKDWLKSEPIVIVKGKGAYLYDYYGNRYIDGNSSIWTNLHGHNNVYLNSAIKKQLKKIAHSSALGLANEPASILAERLVIAANPVSREISGEKKLEKVFYSDDGSTAVEVALKLAYEFARRTGLSKKPRFLSLSRAYHGDTIGSVSLGHIDLFHKTWSALLFKTDSVISPHCYRCKYNRAKPERDDARNYRKCKWECVDEVEKKFAIAKKNGRPYTAFVFEPLIQGAAGIIAHPQGWLKRVSEIVKSYNALLVADEVMTGFGRTGVLKDENSGDLTPGLFACHKENVQPDLMALAKGLTGGYIPMAATLTTRAIFDAFLGEYSDFKTFFHGHSYTGNQLGASVGLASLDLLEDKKNIANRYRLECCLKNEIKYLWRYPQVGDIRQVGLVAGVELVKNWQRRESFRIEEQIGFKVCSAMAKRGVLTRPVGNVIVIMPPFCLTEKQCKTVISVLAESIEEVLN